MTGIAALEPKTRRMCMSCLDDRSRERTRFGERQLSTERTQFPEISSQKSDGRLQPRAALYSAGYIHTPTSSVNRDSPATNMRSNLLR